MKVKFRILSAEREGRRGMGWVHRVFHYFCTMLTRVFILRTLYPPETINTDIANICSVNGFVHNSKMITKWQTPIRAVYYPFTLLFCKHSEWWIWPESNRVFNKLPVSWRIFGAANDILELILRSDRLILVWSTTGFSVWNEFEYRVRSRSDSGAWIWTNYPYFTWWCHHLCSFWMRWQMYWMLQMHLILCPDCLSRPLRFSRYDDQIFSSTNF